MLTRSNLYYICNENGWFTHGSLHQYEKMFSLIDKGSSIKDIALVIWLCSEEDYNSIYKKLLNLSEGKRG